MRLSGGGGSKFLPNSIREKFGEGVRKVVVDPLDLMCTYYPEEDLARAGFLAKIFRSQYFL